MADKPFFNERDSKMIRKMLTGGLALGGSAGLAASLANYIKTLNSERASSSDDDDTMYVTLPPTAEKSASLGGGVALAAGGLGTLGSYAAVRKLYQQLKKKRYQQMLDEAQQGYVQELDRDEDPEKQAAAGKSMGMLELLTSLPFAAPLVLGLGSGVVTHKLLDDAYPTKGKDKGVQKPKRVVIRRRGDQPLDDENKQGPEAQESEKQASFELDYDLDDGAEFLLHLVTSGEKSASQSDLPDLVHALASGRHAELESAVVNGTDFALETVKGASTGNKASVSSLELAHTLAVKSGHLGSSVKLLAAAEYNDMAGSFVKMARTLPEHTQEALAGIACVYGAMLRKEATADILRELGVEDTGNPGEELLVDELRVPDLLEQSIDQLNSRGEVSEEAESGLSLEKDTEESTGFSSPEGDTPSEETDAIDSLMGGEEPPQSPVEEQEEVREQV